MASVSPEQLLGRLAKGKPVPEFFCWAMIVLAQGGARGNSQCDMVPEEYRDGELRDIRLTTTRSPRLLSRADIADAGAAARSFSSRRLIAWGAGLATTLPTRW